MGNSEFFSFVLSLSIYLYWEYEKNDIECEFSTYLQHHKIQNLCGHTSMIIHVCSYWHLSYQVTNCEIMILATDSPYMVLILRRILFEAFSLWSYSFIQMQSIEHRGSW